LNRLIVLSTVCWLIFSLILPASLTALDRPSYIKGNVLDEDTSLPVEQQRIRVYDENWNYLSDISTYTDPDGSYVTGELEPGRYYIRAYSTYPNFYVSEYWHNTYDRETAIPITVEAGVDVSGVDFDLQKGGYIRGTIRDTLSTLLDGVDLDFYNNSWVWLSAFTDRSEADGTYVLGPVPAGTYFIRADPDIEHGCQQRYWPDAWYREDSVFICGAG